MKGANKSKNRACCRMPGSLNLLAASPITDIKMIIRATNAINTYWQNRQKISATINDVHINTRENGSSVNHKI